jgi:hypothetical protein
MQLINPMELRPHQSLSYSIFSKYFMEPEGSLPPSQGSTGSCSEPYQSSPYNSHPKSLRYILKLSYFLVVSFLMAFPLKPYPWIWRLFIGDDDDELEAQ